MERYRLDYYCLWLYHCVSWQARQFWKLETCSVTLWPRATFLRFLWSASLIVQRGFKMVQIKRNRGIWQHAGCSDANFNAILLLDISSSTNYWIWSPKLFQVLFFAQNCPSLCYQKRQVFLDGFCAEGEWGVASISRRAAIRCFGFCCFDQSVIPHCRGIQRDFDVWYDWGDLWQV